MPVIEPETVCLDRQLAQAGYDYFGGLTNRVYRSRQGQEILKLGLVTKPDAVSGKLAAFRQCREISRAYAPAGLMPDVLAVGEDFLGTGYPYLREVYISGINLGAAYLENRTFWLDRLPEELVRIYRSIQATAGVDVRDTWQDKLAGMRCPPGCEEWYAQVRRAGQVIMQQCPVGWRIHGDLQFGNLLARKDQPGTVMLIDWEVSEVMPLAYEFAMLYTFLADPDGQVDPPLRDAYRRQAPLREMWQCVATSLTTQLGLEPAEMENAILFRMGNAWLYQLAQAHEAGDTARAEAFKAQLRALLDGDYFAQMPIA